MGPPRLTFGTVLYGGTTISLAIMACMGIPWSNQGLGMLLFLSALPLLWLNERREARMMQLLQKAMRKAIPVDAADVGPENEGCLVFTSGPLGAGEGSRPLSAPRWGAVAPEGSVGLKVFVEAFQPPQRWSCNTSRGEWQEDCTHVATEEYWSPGAHLGEFRLREKELVQLDAWEPFAPERGRRLDAVVKGHLAEGLQGGAHTLGLTKPPPWAGVSGSLGCLACAKPPLQHIGEAIGMDALLPMPGERPWVEEDGAMLYYAKGGGWPGNPCYGDVRVRFLHIPCGDSHRFTAAGVQRDGFLESFRYKATAPRGIAAGAFESGDFNLGPEGEDDCAVDDPADEESALVGAVHGAYRSRSMGEGDRHRGERLLGRGRDPPKGEQPSRLPLSVQALLAALWAAAEGWRYVLDHAAPEALPCLAPGEMSRFGFFARAHVGELVLAWKLRAFGFMLLAAGLEVAFWTWQLEMAAFGGLFAESLWLVALVGAGGIAATTSAVAAIFYRPLLSTALLGVAAALFSALFGWVTLVTALGFVGCCMCALCGLFALHLALPC
mmetsp:Transcript_108456/g.286016  ORF Transcript_108456/g.286016 Transcript_108456/m.286016 type:complete len:552 (+) Transcript_108456:12-1667(+)